MSPDLPSVAEPAREPADPMDLGIPPGQTSIHQRADASQVWKLCCRIRLEMREYGLGIKDAQDMLFLAYPDLKISQKDLKLFMENYVDGAVIADPAFWKKGLMKAKGKLNAVTQIVETAQKMDDLLDKAIRKVKPEDTKAVRAIMAAGKQVVEVRRIQAQEMAKIGLGAQRDEDAAKEQKAPAAVTIHAKEAHFSLHEAMGGSFRQQRSPAIPADSRRGLQHKDEAASPVPDGDAPRSVPAIDEQR